jgi:hypothetical protein
VKKVYEIDLRKNRLGQVFGNLIRIRPSCILYTAGFAQFEKQRTTQIKEKVCKTLFFVYLKKKTESIQGLHNINAQLQNHLKCSNHGCGLAPVLSMVWFSLEKHTS